LFTVWIDEQGIRASLPNSYTLHTPCIIHTIHPQHTHLARPAHHPTTLTINTCTRYTHHPTTLTINPTPLPGIRTTPPHSQSIQHLYQVYVLARIGERK
jgi:hypothetical protein